MTKPTYLYLHGFASGPGARKAKALADALAPHDVALVTPDLNCPSFRELSISAMQQSLRDLDRSLGAPRYRIVGSSLGGWLAVDWAEELGDRVEKLVLVATPRNLLALWNDWISVATRAEWRSRGSIPLPDGRGKMTRVHIGFYDDVAKLGANPLPVPRAPTLFIHGIRDRLVPIDGVRAFAAEAGAQLEVFDDEHELHNSIEGVTAASMRFLEP